MSFSAMVKTDYFVNILGQYPRMIFGKEESPAVVLVYNVYLYIYIYVYIYLYI